MTTEWVKELKAELANVENMGKYGERHKVKQELREMRLAKLANKEFKKAENISKEYLIDAPVSIPIAAHNRSMVELNDHYITEIDRLKANISRLENEVEVLGKLLKNRKA